MDEGFCRLVLNHHRFTGSGLYAHLLENHYVVPVVGYDSSLMEIFSRDILSRIQTGKSGWEKMVPEKASAIIKERHLFGYKKPEVAGQAL